MSTFEEQWATSWLSGANMAYVDGLYEDFLVAPDSVPESWRKLFEGLPRVDGQARDEAHRAIRAHFLQQASMPRLPTVAVTDESQSRVADLVNAYRTHGHLRAKLDPLEMTERAPAPLLELASHGLTEADLRRTFFAGTAIGGNSGIPLQKLVEGLQETYSGSIGIEYMHLSDGEEVAWLQQAMESAHGRGVFNADEQRRILEDLIAADGLERYLGTRFVGQKRFSLEGGDSLIPLMQELVREGGEARVDEIVIGMAHRGRLNVLVNVLGKSPTELFQEFEGKVNAERTGDVKYHMGFSSNVRTPSGQVVHLALAFNPSHLEIIGPVVEGSVRSRQVRRGDLNKFDTVIPVLIHGDAAFTGQGVVMETFNFSQARGYCTGGTVHVVVNNQIGFTTSNPHDARSTRYCTDVAKMVQAPVLHVNGEDPEAVLFATRIAFAFRKRFKRDVVIDLVCYRRHGHNEADEPSVTQPRMYEKIKAMQTLREKYAARLIAGGIVTQQDVTAMADAYRDRLDAGKPVVETVNGDFAGRLATDWTPYLHAEWDEPVKTAIPLKTIKKLSKVLQTLPEGFELHPVVRKLMADREKMTEGEIPMNWGYAETMAYASLLSEGYAVRLSGQDCGRGTFAHRHAVLHDAVNGNISIPLEQLANGHNRRFKVIDSVLSEEAVLAFEYGYASSDPTTLVLWEAQFGDFANGAQVVIDQFISSGEQKWGRLCGLVMLLPHGYEGQGPEHSSARLERYMQLCAQQNMQVCTPTTPAQIFHLLRRQMVRPYRKPLIVMTPKSLLRHKLAISTLADLTDGEFMNVIPEMDAIRPDAVTRVVLCCGKVYYDLLEKRRTDKLDNVAIIRIEQLYPFPVKDLTRELEKYPHARDVVWCQEEPQNQGVWFSSQHNIQQCLQKKQTLRYCGRDFAAAPAVGSPILHAREQQALVKEALGS